MGVDSSTQSTKVEVRDTDTGEVVSRGRAVHPPTAPPRSEQDPRAWRSAFDLAYAEAGRHRVDGLSVAGQQHGLVVLDSAGEVIRPAKLWNDTESAPDAAWLLDQLPGGATAWADACGSVPVAAFTITKLSWLHRSEPDAWARVAKIMLPHDWLTNSLTRCSVTDRGDASGTGYWSARTGTYRWDLLSIVDKDRDWQSCVPTVLAPFEQAGEWNGAVVGPGTGDNMAAALGIGLRPGDVTISIGTSGTVYAVSDTPTHDASGAVAGFADATGRFLPLVCTMNATKVTDTVGRLLGVDAAQLDDLALSAASGAGGLTLVPYLDGERTPNRPNARGELFGISNDVAREHLARAAYEGVVCGLLEGLEALDAAGVPTGGRLFLVGGGSRSRAYRRVLADLSGRAVTVPRGDEHVALGACVQAAAVLHRGTAEEVIEAWRLGEGETIEPRAIDAMAIRERYAARRGDVR